MSMGEIIITLLVAVLLVIELVRLLQKQPKNSNEDIIDNIKEESGKSLHNLIKEFANMNISINKSISDSSKESIKDLNEFKDGLSRNIVYNFEMMNKKIEEQMDRINKKVEERLNDGFKKTNETFTNIVERLTKIDEAQKNIDKLSTEVVSLQHLLTDKKARGTFGEVQLTHILSSIFGENNTKVYGTQVTLSNGKIADALLYLPKEMGNLAVDSKFPLENYQRMVDRKLTERERELSTRETYRCNSFKIYYSNRN